MKHESSLTYHSKTMVNVKVLADKQMTNGQAITQYAPVDLSMRGHKNTRKQYLDETIVYTGHCIHKTFIFVVLKHTADQELVMLKD